jgi:hypothetical protein
MSSYRMTNASLKNEEARAKAASVRWRHWRAPGGQGGGDSQNPSDDDAPGAWAEVYTCGLRLAFVLMP